MTDNLEYIDYMWQLLEDQLISFEKRVKELEQNKSADVAFGMPQSTLAAAIVTSTPAAFTNPEWRWITDGRWTTASETATNGTGCIAVYRNNTNKWTNLIDGLEVAT